MFSNDAVQSLNDLEFEVYNYVMKNSDKVRYMKIRELAQEVHVSTTTVLRFCKKLNCSGYSEFKLKFKQFMDGQTGEKVSVDTSEYIDFFKKTSAKEFEEKINKVAKVILNAERVILLGSTMSGIVAKYGAKYFSSAGKFSLYIDDPFYPTEGSFYDNTVVVIFSVSGETPETIRHLNRFKAQNCYIISVTNTENCTISKMSDYNIAYYVPYVKYGEYDITTQIPAISIVERIGRRLYNHKIIK